MGSKRLTELQREHRDQGRLRDEEFKRLIAEEFPVGTIVLHEHLDGGKTGTVIGHRYDKVLVCWHAQAEESRWDSLKIAPAVTPVTRPAKYEDETRCQKCGGDGWTIEPACCGNVTAGGECRGHCNVPSQEVCDDCGGSGVVLEPIEDPK